MTSENFSRESEFGSLRKCLLALDPLRGIGVHFPTKGGARQDGQAASFLLSRIGGEPRADRDVISVRWGGMRLTPSSGARLGGPLGVGRLRGRGWRRPLWRRRLRDEREECRELREMDR